MKFILEFDNDEFIGAVKDGTVMALCESISAGRVANLTSAVDAAQMMMDLPAQKPVNVSEPKQVSEITPEPTPAPEPVATKAAVYTIDQIQAACGPLLTAGKGPELHALLGKYGVDTLTSVPAEKLGLFAADLRAMGAQI